MIKTYITNLDFSSTRKIEYYFGPNSEPRHETMVIQIRGLGMADFPSWCRAVVVFCPQGVGVGPGQIVADVLVAQTFHMAIKKRRV